MGSNRLKGSVAVCVMATLLCVGGNASAQSGWQMPHGDTASTGRVAGIGEIVDPTVLWRLSTGGQLSDLAVKVVEVRADGSVDAVMAVGGLVVRSSTNTGTTWDTPPIGATTVVGIWDFNGDGREEVLVLGNRVHLLDLSTGQLVWRSPETLELQNASGAGLQADGDPAIELLVTTATASRVVLYDFSNGFDAATERWRNDEEVLPETYFPIVRGDFDGDGSADELVTIGAEGCELLFLSLDTGVLEKRSPALMNGTYCVGLLQAANVDGSPGDEVILTGSQGQSNGSVSVAVYSATTDALLWSYEYGTNDTAFRTHASASAVGDMNGDGRLELALSVFNNIDEVGDANDGVNAPLSWSVVVYDAETGALLGHGENIQHVGWSDVDDDGDQELITRSTAQEGIQIPQFGRVSVWELDENAQLIERWSLDDVQIPLTRVADILGARLTGSTTVQPAMLSADAGWDKVGLLALHQGETGGADKLQLVSFSSDGTTEVFAEETLVESALFSLLQPHLNRFDAPYVVLKDNLGRIRLLDQELSATSVLSFPGHTSRLLVTLEAEDDATLAFRDSAGSLVAVEPLGANVLAPPDVRWRRPTSTGGNVIAFDRDADGQHEFVHAGLRFDGLPFVSMLSSEGQPLWSVEFPNSARVPTSLVFGQFGGDATLDIAYLHVDLALVREVRTLDGATGATLSTAVVDEAAGRFPNVELLVLSDQNGDSYDDLLHVHWWTFDVRSGVSLERLGGPRNYPDGLSLPVSNAVFQADDDPSPEALFNFFYGGKAVVDITTGEAQWSLTSPEHLQAFASGYMGFSDVNDDAIWDIALPGSLADLSVFDGATGATVYRLCLSDGAVTTLENEATAETCRADSPLSSVVVANIDGVDGDEFIISGADGWIYSIHTATGTLAWSLPLLFRSEQPVVADVDRDGLLEVAVATRNSELVIIDQAGLPAPASVREVEVDENNTIISEADDIDVWTRPDVLGLAWDSVEGAVGYQYAIFTENNNPVRNWTDAGDVTSIVASDLALSPGQRYFTSVIAYDTDVTPSGVANSDGVTIVAGQPFIFDFTAIPNPFDPREEPTKITAEVVAALPLSSVSLQISDENDTVLFEFEEDEPTARSYLLDAVWDGVAESGNPFPEGTYTAELIAEDETGASTSAQLDITIVDNREPDTGEETGMPDVGVEPDTGSNPGPDVPSMGGGDGDGGGIGTGDGGVQVSTGGHSDDCSCDVPGRSPGSSWPLAVLGMCVGALLWGRRQR